MQIVGMNILLFLETEFDKNVSRVLYVLLFHLSLCSLNWLEKRYCIANSYYLLIQEIPLLAYKKHAMIC